MRPSLARKAIEACIEANQPVFVWGEPGIGKSSVIRQIAKSKSRNLIDLRLSLLEPPDLRGFPFINEGQMQFATPSFFPTDPDDDSIIFLDEVNLADPSVLAAAYQLVLERGIGEYKLPPNVAIVAAGNRETDGCNVQTMSPALSNRFVHIDFEANFQDWREHANATKLDPSVVSFINFRPSLLHDFDQDKRAFPTPRSWEFVSTVINSTDDPFIQSSLIAGAVGDGASAEFVSFLKIVKSLPDPDKVLANPTTSEVPDDLATLYALCGALAARVTENNMANLITYCERIKEEFQVLCINDAVSRNSFLANTKPFVDWAVRHTELLV